LLSINSRMALRTTSWLICVMIINPVFFKWPVLNQVLKLIHFIQSGARNVAFFISATVSLY
ncbi:hypothetical protein QBC88_005343, partial [Citrobacter freundii]